MPVMLRMEDYDRWLGVNSDLDAICAHYDAGLMEAYAVSRAVNSVRTTQRTALNRSMQR
jgi:putative SOS response-associated peptidase YedK